MIGILFSLLFLLQDSSQMRFENKTYPFGVYKTFATTKYFLDENILNEYNTEVIINDTIYYLMSQNTIYNPKPIFSPLIKYSYIQYPVLNLTFDSIPYINSKINLVNVGLVNFTAKYSTFNRDILVTNNYNAVLSFDSVVFKQNVFFISNASRDHNENSITFNNTISEGTVKLSYTLIKSLIISNSIFQQGFQLNKQEISADNTTINRLYFEEVTFNKYTNLSNINFSDEHLTFTRCTFNDTLDLTKSSFNSSIDFRRTDLLNVNVLFFEDVNYKIGELLCKWDNIKGNPLPKISLKTLSPNKEDNFRRLEIIYNDLRDNYIQQGDRNSADMVSYELALQKEIVLQETSQFLYGVFMGYGYNPARFLIRLIAPIIIVFTLLWYFFFPQQVAKYYDFELTQNYLANVKRRLFKTSISIPNHKRYTSAFIIKALQSIHYSFTLLFSVRFKNELLKKEDQPFLICSLIEYIIGKSLFVLFAILIENSHLAYIKSLFGF